MSKQVEWRRDVRWLLTDDGTVALIEYKGYQLGHVRYDGQAQWSYRNMGSVWRSVPGSKWSAARALVRAFNQFEQQH